MTTSTAARIAAHRSWARTADRTARTENGRRGLEERFLREARELLGPDATDRQVADSAASLRSAYFVSLSARGNAARQARRGGTQVPAGDETSA